MPRARLVAASLGLWLASCTPPAPADAPREGSAAAEAEAPPGEGSAATAPAEPASLTGAPMPAYEGASASSCRTNEDCRVTQPSDWSPEVECCYDYPCQLDYVAVNRTTWDAIRAWRRANPFDCAGHLQSEGPCAQRPAQCGLSQDPPPAACVEGACVVAWPTPGPEIDRDAQSCTSRADCVAVRETSTSWERHCCDSEPCGGEWVAVARRTVAELELWIEQDLPDCTMWGHGAACPPSVDCDPAPVPDVTCRAGTCGFVD